MEENKQHFWHIMLYYFKSGKNIQKNSAVYGEGVMTDGTSQKRFVKFCAGHFSLDEAPWSARPAEVDSDQIRHLFRKISVTPCGR